MVNETHLSPEALEQALRDLRDIQSPDALAPPMTDSLLPWLVVAIVFAVVGVVVRMRSPMARTKRQLASLRSRFQKDRNTAALAAGLDRLLRDTADRGGQYPGVRGLCGPEWLAFLSARAPDDAVAWRGTLGESLLQWPFRPAERTIDDETFRRGNALHALTVRWISANSKPQRREGAS